MADAVATEASPSAPTEKKSALIKRSYQEAIDLATELRKRNLFKRYGKDEVYESPDKNARIRINDVIGHEISIFRRRNVVKPVVGRNPISFVSDEYFSLEPNKVVYVDTGDERLPRKWRSGTNVELRSFPYFATIRGTDAEAKMVHDRISIALNAIRQTLTPTSQTSS